jgi:hypothetical protein
METMHFRVSKTLDSMVSMIAGAPRTRTNSRRCHQPSDWLSRHDSPIPTLSGSTGGKSTLSCTALDAPVRVPADDPAGGPPDVANRARPTPSARRGTHCQGGEKTRTVVAPRSRTLHALRERWTHNAKRPIGSHGTGRCVVSDYADNKRSDQQQSPHSDGRPLQRMSSVPDGRPLQASPSSLYRVGAEKEGQANDHTDRDLGQLSHGQRVVRCPLGRREESGAAKTSEGDSVAESGRLTACTEEIRALP